MAIPKLYESFTTKFIKSNPYTTPEEVQKTRSEHRELVKTAIEKVKAAVESNQLKLSVSDLDKLMRLDLLLMGEPDSNTQVTPGVDEISQQRIVVDCLKALTPDENTFLCRIMAKITNEKNILEAQQRESLPQDEVIVIPSSATTMPPKPETVKTPIKSVVTKRTPIKKK